MDICVDFDGTVVTHEYPQVGAELPNCVHTLRELARGGAPTDLVHNALRSTVARCCAVVLRP